MDDHTSDFKTFSLLCHINTICHNFAAYLEHHYLNVSGLTFQIFQCINLLNCSVIKYNFYFY